MFYRWEQQTPEKIYLRQAHQGDWIEYTWAQVADRVRRIAAFIRNQNYPAGSRIAIWSANSADWIMTDLAIMLSGHISVPVYPGQDVDSARYILEHSDSQMIFCGSFDQAAQADQAIPQNVTRVAMRGCAIDCKHSIEQIVSEVAPYSDSPIPNGEDVFTIIYTSGTTGNPKGVMHMHQTPGYVVPPLTGTFHLDDTTRMFSFLPLSHAAERIIVDMCSIYGNCQVSFSAGLETFAEEIRSVQPTFFFAVPRLWIKFKEGIDAKIPPETQSNLSAEQKQQIAYQLGFGSAKIILTGSAPCPKDVQSWFLDMGIILRDGYGMTENFIHGCAWTHNDEPEPGCVGRPMSSDVGVRISDAGEIQFKSRGLMKGYYLNPEKTAEVFDDGWYCTGDSGKIDENGNLWVTGRISEVFKTSKGKFIVPTRLENLFARGVNLGQFCVVGHGRTQPLLMATLSEVGMGKQRTELKAELTELLDSVNAEVPSHEKVSQIVITPEWTIENSMLTPTLKLKRNQIESRYKEAMEAEIDGDAVIFID